MVVQNRQLSDHGHNMEASRFKSLMDKIIISFFLANFTVVRTNLILRANNIEI